MAISDEIPFTKEALNDYIYLCNQEIKRCQPYVSLYARLNKRKKAAEEKLSQYSRTVYEH